MLVEMLSLMMMQVPVAAGPPLSPKPHAPVVTKSDDGSVLGAIGARDANVIEVTTLATTKASSSEVKNLATLILHDHQQSLTRGANLAKQLHVIRLLPADSAMARAQVDEMATLNTLTGAAFDKAFVQFIVNDHSAAVGKASGPQQVQASRAQVKAFVRQRVPVLKSHLVLCRKWLAAHP